MLTADPFLLRQLAEQCRACSEHIQTKANQLLGSVQNILQEHTGWQGEAAQNFEKRGDLLVNELSKAGNTLAEIVPTLQTLAYRVENIQYKKQELQQVE